MLTFNIRARNGNYFRGHESSNKYSNCWGDREVALTLSIEQARQLIAAAKWLLDCDIVIAMKSEPISNEEIQREVFCLKGGYRDNFKPL